MTSWILAIDFGTSYTVAAVRVGDRAPEVIEVGGERRVPSVVLIDPEVGLLVGRPADDLAVTHPGNALRAIKNRLGDQSPVILGGRPHQAVTLVAALLSDTYKQILEQMGEPPREVRLTHPATWGLPRLNKLLEAAAKAELPSPVLVPEPVAAAFSYATEVGIESGQHIAVYDLGGGTFDCAVVAARGEEFSIVGRPTGDQNLGGELFDEIIVNHVGEQIDPDQWEAILLGDDMVWQQVGVSLRNEVRRAKEALSSHPYVNVVIPLPSVGLWQTRLTRAEFDDLVRPYVAETMRLLQNCVDESGLDASALAGISLVGGSSRSPIVEQMVKEAFPSVPISRRGDPKAAVAAGATRAPGRDDRAPERRDKAITHEASPGTAPQPVQLAAPETAAAATPPPLAPVSVPPVSVPPVSVPPVSVPPVSVPATPAAPVSVPPAGFAPPRDPAPATVHDATAPTPAPIGVSQASASPRRKRTMILAGACLVAVAALIVGLVIANRGDDDADSSSSESAAELLSFTGHSDLVHSARFSPDSSYVVTASEDGTAKVFDAANGNELASLPSDGPVTWATFSPDGTRLATSSGNPFGDASSGRGRPVTASTTNGGDARIWDASSGELLYQLSGHEDRVNFVDFSPDSGWVVTASDDWTAKVWNVATGELVATMSGHEGPVHVALFSPDGTKVVTASGDTTAKLWDAATGELLLAFEGHDDVVNTAEFSPDGTKVVTASGDGKAKVWDTSSGDLVGLLKGHEDGIYSAVFSPDGTKVVTAGNDHTARIWDWGSGEQLYDLSDHSDSVVWATYNTSGSRVLTVSLDHTAKVWDTSTGELVETLEGHDDAVVWGEFDHDGGKVVTASADNTAILWGI